jgi:dynein heavy chain
VDDEREGRLLVLTGRSAGLADEAIRWDATANELSSQIEMLVGDVFLAAATVSYCGAFTGAFRDRLRDAWVEQSIGIGIPTSTDYSVRHRLPSCSNPR